MSPFTLRVAVVQLNPQPNQFAQTLDRAKSLLNHISNTVDLVVFPEFALTGYTYHSREAISPYLHEKLESPSFKFAQEVSHRFNCYTVIGYPEKTASACYNSALVVSPQGSLVHNYQKSFLYDNDEEWGCQEGPGFSTFDMKFGTRTVKSSIGICMDLNPYKFTAPFTKFEFGNYVADNNVDLVIASMAWLHSSQVTSEVPSFSNKPQLVIKDKETTNTEPCNEPDWRNVQYWATRLSPIRNSTPVILANRSGTEESTIFAGSSTLLKMGLPRPVHYASLGQATEGVLQGEIPIGE